MTEEKTKAPRTIPPKPVADTAVEPTIPTTTRTIVSDGEKFEVEVINNNGQYILTESIYKEMPLPNTTKMTKVLVAAAGSVVQGYQEFKMLVSIQEFRLYMGGLEPEPGLEAEMVNILTGVQQQLETYLNRPVELVQVREMAVSDSKGNLYLSVTPVRKIISYGVTVGVTTPFTSLVPYTVVADSLIGDDGRIIDKVYSKLSLPTYSSWGFPSYLPNTGFLVEYVGGLDGTNMENIKLAIKRVAAREYGVMHVNTAGLRAGNPDITEVGDTRNPGWTIGELKDLQRYRRRIVM